MIVRRTILNAKSSQASDGRMTPPGEGRRAMGTRIPFKAESGMTVIGQDDMTPTPNAMAGAMPSRRLPRATIMAGRRQTSIQQRKTVMALRRDMAGGAISGGGTSAPPARSTRFAPAANMVTYMEEEEGEEEESDDAGDAMDDSVNDGGSPGVMSAGAVKNKQRSRMQTFALGSPHKRRARAMTGASGSVLNVPRGSLDRDVDAEVQKKSLEYVTVPKKRQTMLAGGPGGTGSVPGGANAGVSGGWQHPENKHSLVDEIRAYYLPDGMQESNEVMHRDMYTDKNLLLREAIKYDPQTLGVLAEIWAVVDTDGNGKVDHDEYVTMSKKLYQVFVGADNEAAEREAEKDWSRDSFGYDHLDRTRFAQAWFQLADIWTEEIDCAAYVEFLRIVLDCFSQLNEDGTRVYSGDGEVESYEDVRRRHQARRKPEGPRKQRRVTAIISPQRAQRKRMHVFNKKFRVNGDRKRGLLWDPKVRRHKHGDEPPAPAYSHGSPGDRSHGALWEPKERRRKHIFAKDGTPVAAGAAGNTGGATNSTLDIAAGVQGKGRGIAAGNVPDAPQQASPQSKRQLQARREARMRARKERKERVVARRQRKKGYQALNKLYRGMNSDRSKLVAKVQGMVKDIIASSNSSVEGMLAISSCGVPSPTALTPSAATRKLNASGRSGETVVAADGAGGSTSDDSNANNGDSGVLVSAGAPDKLRQKSQEAQQELVQSGLTSAEANDVLGLIGQQLLSASSQPQPNGADDLGKITSSSVDDAAIGTSLADLIDSAQRLDADGACEDETDEDDDVDDDDDEDTDGELALSGTVVTQVGKVASDNDSHLQAKSPTGGHSRTLSDGSRRAQPLSYDNRRVGGYQPSGTTPSHRRGASGASTVGGASAGVPSPSDAGHAVVQQTQLDWASNIAAPAPGPPPARDHISSPSGAGGRRRRDRDRGRGRDGGIKMAPRSPFDWMDFAAAGGSGSGDGGSDVAGSAAVGGPTSGASGGAKGNAGAFVAAGAPKESTSARRVGQGGGDIIRLRRDAPVRARGAPHARGSATARTRAKSKAKRARARARQAPSSNQFLSVNMVAPALDTTPASTSVPTLSRASEPVSEVELASAPTLAPAAPDDGDGGAAGEEDGRDWHPEPADDQNYGDQQSDLFAPPLAASPAFVPPSPPNGRRQRGRALTKVADTQINVAELAVGESDSLLLASEQRQQLLQEALPRAGANSVATSQFRFDAAVPIPVPPTQHHRPHSIERPLQDSMQHGTVPRRHQAGSLRTAGSRLASLGLKEFRVPVGHVPRIVRPAHLEVPKLRTVKDEVAGPIKFQDYLARLELQKAAEHKMARWPNQRRVRRF